LFRASTQSLQTSSPCKSRLSPQPTRNSARFHQAPTPIGCSLLKSGSFVRRASS